MAAQNRVETAAFGPGKADARTRRSFLTRFFWAAMAAVGVGIAGPVLGYLIGPLLREDQGGAWVRLGKVDDVPLNIPQRLEVTRREVLGWEISDRQITAWVVRLPDKLYVFDPHCTHLGCAYRWDETAKQFFCPCHSAIFSISGNVLSGPPPRPLNTYAYEVREGFIYVTPIPIERVV